MDEGLSGLLKKVEELSLFSGFRFRSYRFVVSHLQYADDIIILEDPTIDNL